MLLKTTSDCDRQAIEFGFGWGLLLSLRMQAGSLSHSLTVTHSRGRTGLLPDTVTQSQENVYQVIESSCLRNSSLCLEYGRVFCNLFSEGVDVLRKRQVQSFRKVLSTLDLEGVEATVKM
jgi:hypothetical protein